MMDLDAGAIAQTIQLSVTPVFLLVATGSLLNVIAGRLARVVDRSRNLMERWADTEGVEHERIVAELRTAPTLLIRKHAFERVGLTRAQFDEALTLTPDEFRVEGGLIAVGPLVGEDTLTELIALLEERGLVYYDDFFELSGNWPAWLRLFVMDAGS